MSGLAFHFGDSSNPLFGIYHHPEGGGPGNRAALLCPPFGQEEIRSNRIFRLLAQQLALSGFHVLRFNYSATGDSMGDCEEATLEQWSSDVVAAHDELKDMSGVNRVTWIGLSIGATIVALAATRRPRGLAGLVLWDAVTNGKAYLAELARGHAEILGEYPAAVEALPPVSEFGMREAMGFGLNATLIDELMALQLENMDRRPARRALIVGEQSAARVALADRLGELGVKLEWCEEKDAGSWNSNHALNAFVVPAATIRAITATVGGWR